MMLLPPHLEDYWQRYLSTRYAPAGRDVRPEDVSEFGNTPEQKAFQLLESATIDAD
jgi:hypothetical protein